MHSDTFQVKNETKNPPFSLLFQSPSVSLPLARTRISPSLAYSKAPFSFSGGRAFSRTNLTNERPGFVTFTRAPT